jgi:hypothetical protein
LFNNPSFSPALQTGASQFLKYHRVTARTRSLHVNPSIITPATIYVKAVIPAKAGIQKTLDRSAKPDDDKLQVT